MSDKRKENDGDNDDQSKKRVRFNFDIESREIENNDINNDINNNNNRNNNNNIINTDFEQDILRSIERGNQKFKEREYQANRVDKFNKSKSQLEKKKVIRRDDDSDDEKVVEGEEDYGDEENEVLERETKSLLKKRVKAEDSDSDDDDDDNRDNRDNEDDEYRTKRNGGNDDTTTVEITPFNLRDETEEGSFDKEGNFVHRKGDKEEDAWLREYDQVWSNKVPKVSKHELKKQNDSQSNEEEDLWEKEEEEQRRKRKQGLTMEEKQTRHQQLFNCYSILNSDKETVVTALRRLGGSKKPGSQVKLKNSKKKDQPIAMVTEPTKEEAENKYNFDKLTEAADILLSSGLINIYSETKESIKLILEKENSTLLPSSSSSTTTTTTTTTTTSSTTNQSNHDAILLDKEEEQFEYKLSDGNIYGPFPRKTLREWKDAGYFANVKVLIRNITQFEDYFTLLDLVQL